MSMMLDRIERVVILGCGPAGLFAAHAASTAGREVHVFSKRRKSEMYGAQYLHRPIPGLTKSEPVRVRYELRGTAEGYRQRVYGAEGGPDFVSPDRFSGERDAWDIREAYDTAWDLYGHRIQAVDGITGADLLNQTGRNLGLLAAFHDYPRTKIISTIPVHHICVGPSHVINANRIWAMGDAPERGIKVPIPVDRNTIVYNGELAGPSWARVSNIFSYTSAEWPWNNGRRPPIEHVTTVTKVVSTTCDCFLPKIWRAGRNGTWNKSILAHDAYFSILAVLTGQRM